MYYGYMSKLGKWIYYWLPVAAWMTMIFYLSSRMSIAVSEAQLFNFLIFKTLHILEYAILYFLIFRGFYLIHNRKSPSKIYTYALVIAVLYAASDEIHQTFVPTREGTVRDAFIDMIGIFLMYIFIKNRKITKLII